MAITIIKPNETILTENLTIVIYGQPGVGKSSLGFTTDKPIMFDFDLGSQRALNRKDVVRVNKWQDIANLTESDVKDYNTIIIDTAGRLLESMAQSIIKENPRMENKTNGGLSLPGYGLLNTMFKNFISKIKSYHKDIILICHDKEDKQGDNIVIRPEAIGSSKSELIKMADLLGYVSMDNKNHVLDFNPTDRYIGKNCAKFELQVIPDLHTNLTYFGDLIKIAKERMNNKSEAQLKYEQDFNNTVEVINENDSPEFLTHLITTDFVKGDSNIKAILWQRSKDLGLSYNKETKAFEKVKKDEGLA